MSVIRVKHQSNYVVILNNTVLSDPNLSFKSKGIWTYCMAKPDDWKFRVVHLIEVSKDSRDSVLSGLKELETAGYLKRIRNRGGGKFSGFDYEISEVKIIVPQQENPLTENPLTANRPLLSIDSSLSIEKELNLVKSSQVLADAEILRKMSMEVNDVKSGLKSYEQFSEKEIRNILNTYSHEELYKSAINCVNRKKNKRDKLGPIQSEKAYFLDSLKKIKDGVYKT